MYHPTTRVLTILELLQAHPQLSGADLAARLEVDRRTVRRYVMMLQDLGIPIDTERGPYGGYRLRPGFKMPPLMLTNDEALAVTLSVMSARAHGVAAEPHTIAGALAKIERVLPEALRVQLQAVQTSVVFNASAKTEPADSELFLTVSSAVQQRRRVQLTYTSRGDTTERPFDPYGLVYQWERWYAVGWCHLRDDIRLFRLDRVLAASLQADTFERPADFDSLAHVHHSLATTPWGWEVEVLLDTTLEQAQQHILPGLALLEPSAEGVTLRAYVDDLDWLARQLVGLPYPCMVRRPEELKQAFREVAARAMTIAAREAV